jgi:phosphoribosylamine---glycine ligase
MKILILGSGGREHALSWRLAQDPSCQQLLVWPGNPGMSFLPGPTREKIKLLGVPYNKVNLREIIEIHRIDLVIPGAEKFLYEGVADWCAEWNVPCLGPSGAAASLERSKLFAKKIMQQGNVPTAKYADLTEYFGDAAALKQALTGFERPVIKLSGPSLGKGVFVCPDQAAALGTLQELKASPMPGLEEGLLVEEGLRGQEVSLFYACNGTEYLYLGAAQDHKRLLDLDQGPNTGGMGTVSPVSWADSEFVNKITESMLIPTLKCMQQQGTPFKGILFLGLMVDGAEANLLEYNVRFGDPETQALLPLITGDLSLALYQLATGQAVTAEIGLQDRCSIHVVKAARGYPGLFGTSIEKGQKIILDIAEDNEVSIFFAGVKEIAGELFSDGGRVLGLTALADSRQGARELVYAKMSCARFEGEHFRRDIGAKA